LTGHRVIARRPSTFLQIPVGSHRQGFAFAQAARAPRFFRTLNSFFLLLFCPDISTTGRARAVPEPRPIEAPSRRRIVFSSF
jgi:hypothetical protein